MARQVRWSHEAATDLESIAEYISRDSTYYAAAFVEEVLSVADTLERFSGRGRVVPEVGEENIRELFVKGYRLLYRIGDDSVLVLGVIHGRRDLGRARE
jgi:plasmid stabilization system protein ParE